MVGFVLTEEIIKKGCFQLSEKNDFLNLEDTRHSLGYQIYLAIIYKIFPDKDKIFRVIKIISWITNFLCILLIFYLGEKYFCKYAGAIAAVLLSFSFKYLVYINLLQYEILVSFLLLLYIY